MGRGERNRSKTYDAYKASIAAHAHAEADVDVDVPTVVVAAAIVEVPPCSCVENVYSAATIGY